MKAYEKSGTIVVCDGCRSERIKEVDLVDLDVLGYFGSAVWHHEGGATGADWFACKKECIADAVTTALERTYD